MILTIIIFWKYEKYGELKINKKKLKMILTIFLKKDIILIILIILLKQFMMIKIIKN
jgi:uncharacterized membrane protein (DUF485 family)